MAFVRELNLDKAHILPDINVVGEFYGRRCHAARFFQTFFMLLLTTKKFAVKYQWRHLADFFGTKFATSGLKMRLKIFPTVAKCD